MSADLWNIKKKILEEERIEYLLNAMGCQLIKPRSNRYEAQLPDKFDSNNQRAVQVYINENLTSRVRNMGLSSNLDIYGLVSFLVFDIHNESLHLKNLPKAKRWICETLGFSEFLAYNGSREPNKADPLQWLKDLKKKRNKKTLREFSQNEMLPDSILNQYVMYPYYQYIKEGLEYQTQVDFQVGYDIQSERVVYPIHNQFGDIISIKGRTTDPLYKDKGIYKFLYLYNFNKMIELYNWHRAIDYIHEKKEIIIFEGEKSCWLATQFGFSNCVAVGGDDLSDYQVKMIKDLGIEIKIMIALDKDKSVDDFKKQGKKFGQSRQVYALWDAHNLLSKELKQSPVDNGYETFLKLYKDSFKHRMA